VTVTDTIKAKPFIRTRFTWFAYLLMVVFGTGVAMPGPIVPFIGERLALSFAERGYHFTALAAGNLLMGLFGDRIADRIGNRTTAWLAITGTAIGGVSLIYGTGLWMTLPAALVLGTGSGAAALISTATLADAHPVHQSRAIIESNIVAGIGVATMPLLVGILERSGFGWQTMAYVMAGMGIVLALVFHDVAFPIPRSQSDVAMASGSGDRPLPPLYWVFGIVVFLTVAVEWVIISWTPDFLSTIRGFDRGTAAALGSGFAWAVVFGRVFGRWLLEKISPDRLLLVGFGMVIVLFPIYVYAPNRTLSLIALVLLGLTLANQFPLVLAAAMDAGEEQTNRASARVSVFGGLASLLLPQTVGSLADQVGLQQAYLVVLVLAALGGGMTLYALRMRGRVKAKRGE
jgi:fucose permease